MSSGLAIYVVDAVTPGNILLCFCVLAYPAIDPFLKSCRELRTRNPKPVWRAYRTLLEGCR